MVNCAGLYADTVEQMRTGGSSSSGEQQRGVAAAVDFTVTPRKGQFVVFSLPRSCTSDVNSDSNAAPAHIIEPVPTQFTKGVIVFTTVYGNVIVGPTAVDQTDKRDRSTGRVSASCTHCIYMILWQQPKYLCQLCE